MAVCTLELKISYCQPDCKHLIITDVTAPTYDSTGWAEGGNIDYTDAIGEIILELTDPNGDTWDLSDLMDTAFTVASSIDDLYITITSDDIGLSDSNGDDTQLVNIPDGLYTLTYTVNDTTYSDIHTLMSSVFLTCQTECCVDSLIAGIPSHYECENCDNTYINKTLLSFALVQAMKSAVDCTNISEAENILTTIQRLCNFEECTNCN